MQQRCSSLGPLKQKRQTLMLEYNALQKRHKLLTLIAEHMEKTSQLIASNFRSEGPCGIEEIPECLESKIWLSDLFNEANKYIIFFRIILLFADGVSQR